MKMIEVKGVSELSLRPNKVEIRIEIREENKKYDTAIAKAEGRIQTLIADLSKADFSKEDIKTMDFSVDSIYDSVRQENGDYTREFKGFAILQNLKIQFKLTEERLAKVLNTLTASSADVPFYVSFTLSNAAEHKAKMIELAVSDAKYKAETLARASGVTLKNIQKISYGSPDLSYYSKTNLRPRAMKLEANFDGASIQPDDVKLSDSVVVEWEIE